MDTQETVAIIGVIIALIQVGLIPFLTMLRSDVRTLRTAMEEVVKSIASLNVKMAEMNAADQLATSVATRALDCTDEIRHKYHELNSYVQDLVLKLASNGTLKKGEIPEK